VIIFIGPFLGGDCVTGTSATLPIYLLYRSSSISQCVCVCVRSTFLSPCVTVQQRDTQPTRTQISLRNPEMNETQDGGLIWYRAKQEGGALG
jgi:hypothetical protein